MYQFFYVIRFLDWGKKYKIKAGGKFL